MPVSSALFSAVLIFTAPAVRAESPKPPAESPDLTPLLKAAFKGDDQAVRRLIAKKADVNAKTKQGITALMYAGLRGSADATAALLAAGADAKAKDKLGQDALTWAVMFDKAKLPQVRLLIDAGCDVNAKGPPKGTTPLMWAANRDAYDIAQALVKAGADVNARQSDGGWTALMRAAVVGSARIAMLLRESGADLSVKDRQGRDAAALAREHHHPELEARLKP
jgi:ankyrin repeat protein